MNAIRNILALLGLIAVVAIAVLYPKAAPYLGAFQKFDPKAMDVYVEMMDGLVKTGNPAEAMIWKVQVKDGLKAEDVEESLKVIANEHNFMLVGRLPFYQQIEAITGKPYRKVLFYLMCDALIGRDMLDVSDAYSAFMPCRISLVEDKSGRLWLYTLNMDSMIYGGTPLPADLKTKAEKVKKIMLDIMNRAAKGEF
ncbi:MAG: DUF302 domain-containing protein [Magnetospirillum sp. WYHS-4]